MNSFDQVYQRIDSLFQHGLISFIITLVTVLIFVFIVNKIANKVIKKKFPDPLKRVFPTKIKKVVLVALILIVVLSELSAMQSILTTLLASGGIIAVVIGLASQEAASNLINGFMIMSYKPYSIGDLVNVKEYNVTGRVVDISMRHSIIETFEKTQVIIPNTIMNKAIIENVSNVKNNQKANYLYVEVSYECDIQRAIEIIQEEGYKHPLCLDGRTKAQKKRKEPTVAVHCVEFNASGIQLRATVLSKDSSTGFQLLSDLRLNIKKRFDEEGIEIPYPHQVVISETQKNSDNIEITE
ncbi:mechanosensitive ion channel family protein [uncultured Thomasclavelia sp.]|uniref:mechanosensitive ion channel family protein n=1 Tax=uncultured Thomasclavelia sp. TaxID=3025759 RepID=UPI0025D0D1AD|nr:mechanosensitive ion channel family protein [uncultured Thomasclavelia sp.]